MFFFPFSDDNPTSSRPYVTYCIIGMCCFIFLWQITLPPNLFESSVYNFGVIPASLLGSKEGYLPSGLTILTSMFMHGGWMHLIGNIDGSWDGNVYKGKTYCIASHIFEDDGQMKKLDMAIIYEDTLERRDGIVKFVNRNFNLQWQKTDLLNSFE